MPAISSWRLSHGSKTTPVSTNERNTKTMVAQSHVRQADDALVAVSNGSHNAKAWCYCGTSTHPTGGASCRECPASSKKKYSCHLFAAIWQWLSQTRVTREESRSWTCQCGTVKDAKAPACCALAAPECKVTSERCVSTSTDCTEYRNRTQK